MGCDEGGGSDRASTMQGETVILQHGTRETGICIHALKATIPSKDFAFEKILL